MKQTGSYQFDSSHQGARVLIFSQRNFNLKVFQCWMYEFEDVISEVDAVHMLTPSLRTQSYSSRLTHKLVHRVRMHISRFPDTGINESVVDRDYDLFFSVFLFPAQLLFLNKLEGWRQRCRKTACYLGEVWTKDVERLRGYLELLRDFDHIFLHIGSSLATVADIVKRPCHFMPVGVDSAQFCPYPSPPYRSIDCYSMGRRSPATHRALLDLAEREGIFYVYDTVNDFSVIDYREHRRMVANLIKRNRYFISYKHNVNLSDKTGGEEALGARLFEGTAGGAVMLGIPPACEEYDSCFDWPDATIPIPYEPADMADILADLDAQPERLARARRNNIVNSLRRHDWVYRWGRILETVGLERTPAMEAREVHLNDLAEMAMAPEGLERMAGPSTEVYRVG